MSAKWKNFMTVILTAGFLFGFLLFSIVKKDDAISISERRSLASFPTPGVHAVWNGTFMKNFETYTLDQFPMRDQFRTLKAAVAVYVLRQRDNHEIYIADGYASKLEYPLDLSSLQYAQERFQFVYDTYLRDRAKHIYFSIIPDKNYFLAKENGYPSMDYAQLFSNMREHMEYAEYLDIAHFLELDDYYRTDTHWRQEKILDVARYLSGEMGIAQSAEYEKKKTERPFYGVYYGQSALPLSADEMFYLDNEMIRDCRVYDYEADEWLPVYDQSRLAGSDPYEMFLSGPKSLLALLNPNASSDRELILFRDSFGSSLAPLLAEGYSRITLVDIRYLSPNVLGRFLSFDDKDVLFCYSTSVLNNSITIK